MWYVYLIQSQKDKQWYTGCTNDLRKRLVEHNTNKSESTKGKGPFDLIYYEACISKTDAFRRERYLENGWGGKWLKKVKTLSE